MTKQTFFVIVFAALLIFLPQAGFAQVTVLYGDNFDSDSLATNGSVGGGLDSGVGAFTVSAGSAPGATGYPVFQDDGTLSLTGPANGSQGGRMSAMAWTQNAFAVSNGFTLEVTFDINQLDDAGNASLAPFPSNTFSFGLWDQAASAADVGGAFVSAIPGTIVPPTLRDGIGISLTDRNGNATPGLVESNGSPQGETLLSANQLIATGSFQTFSLSVDQFGNFSYQLNGATPSVGTTNLDLSNDYQFVTFIQGSDGESRIRSVRLTSVPEPASTGLLALTALGLVGFRRRRQR